MEKELIYIGRIAVALIGLPEERAGVIYVADHESVADLARSIGREDVLFEDNVTFALTDHEGDPALVRIAH